MEVCVDKHATTNVHKTAVLLQRWEKRRKEWPIVGALLSVPAGKLLDSFAQTTWKQSDGVCVGVVNQTTAKLNKYNKKVLKTIQDCGGAA